MPGRQVPRRAAKFAKRYAQSRSGTTRTPPHGDLHRNAPNKYPRSVPGLALERHRCLIDHRLRRLSWVCLRGYLSTGCRLWGTVHVPPDVFAQPHFSPEQGSQGSELRDAAFFRLCFGPRSRFFRSRPDPKRIVPKPGKSASGPRAAQQSIAQLRTLSPFPGEAPADQTLGRPWTTLILGILKRSS